MRQSTQQHYDMRSLLQHDLALRCNKNKSYSLRSYARFLEIDPSRLSKILKKKRPISMQLALKIAEKLDISLEEVSLLMQKKSANLDNNIIYQQLELDHFEVIALPIHYTILELIKLDNFTITSSWICKKLNISKIELDDAIERLERIGLLVRNDDNQWIDQSRGHRSHIINDVTSSLAHKQHHQAILEEAKEKLKTIDIEYRDNSSMVMATSRDRILEAKKMITNFRREITTFLENSERKDAIYTLGVVLFPVTEE